MSGKAYTMKEMKDIVEYLTEHRAYSDVKGRKMWIDYANSKLTSRTWQSLKETFLKRILPDICNPYYQLTVQQIASFREGSDIEARLKNKLEIQTVDEDSSNNDDQNKKQPESRNENKEADGDDRGEDSTSKIKEQRSSTDTVVIEPCYSTAEEIQKDLESPKTGTKDNYLPNRPSQSKSIRDYITYSEPLTPILQEVLHDFETDEENGSDKEPQMQIVEYPDSNNGNDDGSIEIKNTENNDTDPDNNKITKADKPLSKQESNLQEDNEEVNLQNPEPICIHISEDTPGSDINANGQVKQPDDNPDTGLYGDSEKNIEISKDLHVQESENKSLSMTDTLLPNNQEAFKELCEVRKSSISRQNFKQPILNNKDQQRKRSQSLDIQNESPSKRLRSNKSPQKAFPDIDAQKHENLKIEKFSSQTQKSNSLKNSKSKTAKQEKKQTKTETNIEEEGTTLNNNNNLQLAENTHVPEDDESNKQSLTENEPSKSVGSEKAATSSEDRDQTKFFKEVTKIKSKDRRELKKRRELNDYHKKKVTNGIVMFQNSDSTSDHVMVTPKKSKAHYAEHKIHRNKALTNVFGFSSRISTSHKKQKKYRRMPSHQTMHTSESEEWTSETESEYVSPPRGRKNRNTRKYLKPKSARILSLEENGGLFVMYGKKIYPVVKDGKILNSYITYSLGRDSEDEESYWKLKYVEEKKKTEELTRLLKDNKIRHSTVIESEVPVTKAMAEEKPPTHSNIPKENIPINQEFVPRQPISEDVKEVRNEAKTIPETKTVKIKYMKNNEEVQLEGHWSQVHPALEHVVHLLHKDPRSSEIKPAIAEPPKGIPAQTQTSSRDSTPSVVMVLDEEVTEKVNKLEDEIFKEIEEREKADSSVNQDQTANVTQRKVTLQKPLTVTEESPAKESKASTDSNKTPEKPPDKTATPPASRESGVVTRSRTPKLANDKETNVNETKRVTRKSIKDQTEKKPKVQSPSQPKKATKVTKKRKATKRYNANGAKTFSSPDNISNNSVESSQGYQDSDASISICLKRKRNLSLNSLSRGKAKTKGISKKETKYATDGSSDSNLSFVTAPLKFSSHRSSSLNSEIYRTDSYQLLFPQIKNTFTHLDKIEEHVPTLNKTYCINHPLSNLHTDQGDSSCVDIKSPSLTNDGENSSHVTFPPSPVLSIVEHISVRRDDINNNSPIDQVNHTMLNEYMCSDVDMSVPLMEQNCGLQKSSQNESKHHYNIDMVDTSQKISDSFVNKVDAVKIEEHSLSESIQQKLKNLLLESAKKLANRMSKGDNKDIESKTEVSEPVIQRKPKRKKRCSTPRKRQSVRNVKSTGPDIENTEPLIIQEHKESCGSKKPAPPPLVVVTNAFEDDIVTINSSETTTTNACKTKTKKKKDIIKVKIQKPNIKKKASVSHDTLQKAGKSLQTDSGMNDTESGVFLQGCDDSVDLIHNHSDTCLHAHECIGDSVEIIKNTISVISLNTNSIPVNELKISKSLYNLNENVLLDMICENAQDAVNLFTDTRNSNSSNANISSINSLLTDDLSDDPIIPEPAQKRVSKWYLFSEDETSNTKEIPLQVPTTIPGYGSNLQDIFPVTCAVPDLSTITEEIHQN